jgi:LysM repeat protein
VLVVIILVVVAMAATATATGARRRVPPPPQAITVYCTGVHGVKAGETCGSVARDARLPLPQFMDLNQNVTCGALFPGQWVCVRGVAIA